MDTPTHPAKLGIREVPAVNILSREQRHEYLGLSVSKWDRRATETDGTM